MDFEERLQDIIKLRFNYENCQSGYYPELNSAELEELCVLYAHENKSGEKYADGLTIDNCDDINEFVRRLAQLCLYIPNDELYDHLDEMKDIARKSFVKAYKEEIENLFHRGIFEKLNASKLYKTNNIEIYAY